MNHTKQNVKKTCSTHKGRRHVIDYASKLKVCVKVRGYNYAPYMTRALKYI